MLDAYEDASTAGHEPERARSPAGAAGRARGAGARAPGAAPDALADAVHELLKAEESAFADVSAAARRGNRPQPPPRTGAPRCGALGAPRRARPPGAPRPRGGAAPRLPARASEPLPAPPPSRRAPHAPLSPHLPPSPPPSAPRGRHRRSPARSAPTW
jgi:hypothetical protein